MPARVMAQISSDHIGAVDEDDTPQRLACGRRLGAKPARQLRRDLDAGESSSDHDDGSRRLDVPGAAHAAQMSIERFGLANVSTSKARSIPGIVGRFSSLPAARTRRSYRTISGPERVAT